MNAVDQLARGVEARRRSVHGAVEQLADRGEVLAHLLGEREHRLLDVAEVLVEGRGRRPDRARDVDDAQVADAVALEQLGGRLEQPSPRERAPRAERPPVERHRFDLHQRTNLGHRPSGRSLRAEIAGWLTLAAMSEQQRIALVTGASTGIGRAIAVELSQHGWPVAIGARRRERLEETAEEVRAPGGRRSCTSSTCATPRSIDTMFAACEAELGVVDVIVNNAGLSYPGWLQELSSDEISREVTTNLIGPMLVSRRAVGALRTAERPGDIVFITSDAVRYARPRQGVYAGTKAGLEQFARSLGMELEGTGIRSTTVASARASPSSARHGTWT